MDWTTAPIGKFWWLVGYTAHEHREWRQGQCTFNVLAEVRPDLSEQLRATPLDAFRDDRLLNAMCAWIEAHW